MEQVPGVDLMPTGVTRVISVMLAMAVACAGVVVPGLRPSSVESTLALFGGYLCTQCVVMPLVWRGRLATPENLARWKPGRLGVLQLSMLALFWMAVVAMTWRIIPAAERPVLPLASGLQAAILALEVRRAMRAGCESRRDTTNQIALSLAACAGASVLVHWRGAPHFSGWFAMYMLMISAQAWSGPVRARSAA